LPAPSRSQYHATILLAVIASAVLLTIIFALRG
jgi:hypothetical protein